VEEITVAEEETIVITAEEEITEVEGIITTAILKRGIKQKYEFNKLHEL
jgi:uncharacterized protein YajQ (UPF0234 family)